MWLRRNIIVTVCMGALVAGGAIAFAVTSATSHAGSRWREVAIHKRVVLLPSGEAGVGGWCLTTFGGSAGDRTGCTAGGSPASGGPIVAEELRSRGFVVGRGAPVRTVIVLTTAQVAAVSFEGYAPIATHSNALLPDHMRGAVLELRGRTGELSFQALDSIKIIAWSKDGGPIARTMARAPALAFGVPSRTWSRGQRASRGVCGISVSGLDVSFREGTVMTAVRPHRDVRGREFVNCARLDYWLSGKWFIGADVLLDAAHPGATPARLPGIRPLSEHSGIFLGAGAEGKELARRIPGAWLLVTQGRDLAQRLALLEHLRTTVHLAR